MTLGSEESEHPKLTNGEIIFPISKYSNLCDHNTSTSWTDRQAIIGGI